MGLKIKSNCNFVNFCKLLLLFSKSYLRLKLWKTISLLIDYPEKGKTIAGGYCDSLLDKLKGTIQAERLHPHTLLELLLQNSMTYASNSFNIRRICWIWLPTHVGKKRLEEYEWLLENRNNKSMTAGSVTQFGNEHYSI